MKVKIYQFYLDSKDQVQVSKEGFVNYKGEETDPYIIAEICWDLCNWSCWSDKKPKELKSDLSVCNSDVAFEINKTLLMAQSIGWTEIGSIESVLKKLPENCFLWHLKLKNKRKKKRS